MDLIALKFVAWALTNASRAQQGLEPVPFLSAPQQVISQPYAPQALQPVIPQAEISQPAGYTDETARAMLQAQAILMENIRLREENARLKEAGTCHSYWDNQRMMQENRLKYGAQRQ